MTKAMVQAVIFDLDGTLLDSAADVGDAVNRVLSASGFPIHPTLAYYRFMGEGVVALMRRALPEHARSPEMIQRGVQAFFQEYEKTWNRKTRPYPGVSELLDGLVRRGILLAVLSNKPHGFTTRCVQALLSRWSFAAVKGQREGVPRKPDPAGAIEIAALLNIPPSDILFLGDTAVDMKTAAAAGMIPVGACWGFRPARELLQGGGKHMIDHPAELLRFFDDTRRHTI